MRPVVAVDLGGTNIRAAFYPEGQPPARSSHTRSTPASAGPQAVVAQIHASIEELAIPPAAFQSMAIGIGAPGPLDSERGIVLHAPNLPGWDAVPLTEMLSRRWDCPVHLQNDANLAALGEWRYGSGKGVSHMLMLTLGTGIGGGVIVGDRLLEGQAGLAGELGHLPVLPDGPRCSCGQRGHLEAVASGTAIAAEIERRGGLRSARPGDPPATSAEVAAAAAAGDAIARQVLQVAAAAIGTALAGLTHVFNPSRIVLGGGVSRAGGTFLSEVEQALFASLMLPAFGDGLRVVASSLGDEAALLGALELVHARQ